MLAFGALLTHDTTAVVHRWTGQWGISYWSADNKAILRRAYAVHDDFGDLHELRTDDPSSLFGLSAYDSGQIYFDDEVLAQRRYHHYEPVAQAQPGPVTVEVIETEGLPTEFRIGHDRMPYGLPLFRVDAGFDDMATLTRGQLLALITAAAPLLGLQVETAPAVEH